MNFLITICARGGSKGIPGKNIKKLNNIPLIAYSIKVAQQFKNYFGNVDIILSTDSFEIKKVAEEYGLVTDYIRPVEMAGDTIGKMEAIKDVLCFNEQKLRIKYDYVIDLDVTSPLRNLNDLINAFEIINTNSNAINLFSVSPANRNPYFNMVEENKNGFFTLIKSPENTVLARQAAPKVYDLNASFYFYKRFFFDFGYNFAITDKSLVYVVPHLCFDLDHPIDFEFLSFLLANNKLDFEL